MGKLPSETAKKDSTEEKQEEMNNGVWLTQMRRFLGNKSMYFNLQSGRYVWGLWVYWIIYILLKPLQLLQEASLILSPLVKKEEEKKVTQMILLHYDHTDVKVGSPWEVQSAA